MPEIVSIFLNKIIFAVLVEMYIAVLKIKWGNRYNLGDFLFSITRCCDHSLEPSRQDGSNDGHNISFQSEKSLLIIPVTPSYREL